MKDAFAATENSSSFLAKIGQRSRLATSLPQSIIYLFIFRVFLFLPKMFLRFRQAKSVAFIVVDDFAGLFELGGVVQVLQHTGAHHTKNAAGRDAFIDIHADGQLADALGLAVRADFHRALGRTDGPEHAGAAEIVNMVLDRRHADGGHVGQKQACMEGACVNDRLGHDAVAVCQAGKGDY